MIIAKVNDTKRNAYVYRGSGLFVKLSQAYWREVPENEEIIKKLKLDAKYDTITIKNIKLQKVKENMVMEDGKPLKAYAVESIAKPEYIKFDDSGGDAGNDELKEISGEIKKTKSAITKLKKELDSAEDSERENIANELSGKENQLEELETKRDIIKGK